MSGCKVEQGQEPRLLPVVKLNGPEFLVDIENRLFRDFTNPDEVVGMHSQQDRKMLKVMQASVWKSYGLSTRTTDEAEVRE